MRTNALKKVIFGYALAVVSVSVAMLFTRFLRGIGDFGISPLFFAAVLLTAWYGGFGPGLLATLLSGIATAWLVMKEHGAGFSHIGDHFLRAIVFSIVAVLASSLHVAMRRAAEASRREKEAAESASEAKSRFLAMVSHELRTPLSPVLMLTEILEHDPELPARLVQDIRVIRRNVDLEIRLIEDLVDLTRITAGKMHLKEQVLDLTGPLNLALDVCRDDIRDKQLGLNVNLSAERTRVFADPVRLQQVFWNLIRNAVKFTPEGGRLSVRACNAAEATVTVEISDTGIGIDPQRLSCIFKAFEQGEADIQIRFGGLGLGLAICQALVEAQHGTIVANSEGRNRGATFSVTLPVAGLEDTAAGNHDIERARESQSSPSATRPNS
jgi:signal transduction histidine kinase